MRKFTNFNIILRGKPVEQYIIVDNLKFSEVISYKPKVAAASKEVSMLNILWSGGHIISVPLRNL